MTEKNKLFLVRKLLTKHGINAYLQPVHDEWMSEYPPTCNRRVEWLTGFSGSAGLVVITDNKAALFVDGRYTLQAKEQVSSDYDVFNSADVNVQSWLAQQLKTGEKIGYDPKLYSKAMLEKFAALLLSPTYNLVDILWENRPPAPATKIFVHDIKYSGESAQSKRQRMAEAIKKTGADLALIYAPESVNWLFNIRAHDTENTPLCLAFAVIGNNGLTLLYVDEKRIDEDLLKHLGENVKICTPDSFSDNKELFSGRKILCDLHSTPIFFIETLEKSGAEIIGGSDPCSLPKAIKNPIELSGIRSAHIRDGAAVTKLLYWLSKQKEITELEIVDKILLLRSKNELFVEPSFDTIAGSGEHGAIVHYRATEKSNRCLKDGELFLLDSGGQYLDGTTDITRTVAIGNPTEEQKRNFTLVLKGHIALATAVFPEGTAGSQLDLLARQYLWQEGLDYDHGTGHGVGCFLSVHEGPQRISKRAGDAPIAVGMILSNEPGYYKTGEYGIRIENLVTVVEKFTGDNNKKYFGFETITCAPLDRNLIEEKLLTDAEKLWVNNYQNWVKLQLLPLLNYEEKKWLEEICNYF